MMLPAMHETALELFAWWRAPTSERSPLLGPGFEARTSMEGDWAEMWMWIAHGEHRAEPKRLIGAVGDAEHAALFFEFFAPATLLNHRVGWWLEGRAGQVDRLIECNGHVWPRPSRGEAPAAVVMPPARPSEARSGSLEQAVAALVAWWAAPTPEVPAVFHEDAELIGQGGPEETLSGWLGVRVGEAGAVVRVHGTVASETAAAVFFDDITPGATSKRLVAWWIEGDTGGIRRILDTSTLGPLPAADSPPSPPA